MNDPVTCPKHYTYHPSGVEAIEIASYMDFCTGNAFKYVFRAEEKEDMKLDYQKALWYIDRGLTKVNPSIMHLVQRVLKFESNRLRRQALEAIANGDQKEARTFVKTLIKII